MPTLKPTFTLTIGSVTSATDSAVAGPRAFGVERDMDIAADALQIHLMDRADIGLDDPVELKLGHDGDEEVVFTGQVVKLKPTLTGSMVLALGKLQKLLQLRSAARFENQSIGAIARDLLDQAGLDVGTVDDGPTLPWFTVDRRLSGFAHLKDLADRLGFELYARRDGSIMFHALGAAAGLDSLGGGLGGALAGTVSSLLGGAGEGYQFGQHLIQAQADRQVNGWNSVAVGGESPTSGQGDRTAHWLTVNDADYRGEAGSGNPKLTLLDPAARTKDLADRFAAGRLVTAQRTAHQVTFTVLGRPQVELGDDLSVSGVPDNLVNGSGYVRAIHHRFSTTSGFVTELRIALAQG